ncbi:prefoldin subunit 2 [Kwoniella heveanensis BCC8398]|uniref:Prefoldin subunit 2 n=1 Tax=Kwoniella heveanensis BCC8398 TaxID=1296120 RepID=A0A1B9GVI2_9TREE|nr:prefoldin subunit 2 [Kwoniella heveanensis BCC8398]
MPPKPAQQKPNPQEVPMIFQRYRTELQNLAQKIGEIESEMDEHALIGGTLVKRNVTDVVPSLETNYNGIKEVLDGLVKSYKAKEGEFEKWREEMGVQVSHQPHP